jgi:nitroreductase
MELIEAIARRHSTRAYTTEQLSEQALQAILLAGSAGPVGMGKYEDVHLSVVQDSELLTRISKAAAAARGTDDDPLYAAPTLIVISHAPTIPNLDYVNVASIAENMALAATALGVGSVIIWSSAIGIAADAELSAAIGFPNGFKPLLGIVFGIPAADADLQKDLSFQIATNRV